MNFRRVFGGDLAKLPVNNKGNKSSFSPGNGSSTRIVHFYRSFVARLRERVNPALSIPTNSVNINKHRVNCVCNRCGHLGNTRANILANGPIIVGKDLTHARTAKCNLICCARRVLGTGNGSFTNRGMIISKDKGITVCTVRGIRRFNKAIMTYSSSGNCVCSRANVSIRLLRSVGRIHHRELAICTTRGTATICGSNDI